jgi:hypothetical protein
MILRLTTGHENGLPGASQERREGRGFSPAATLHTLTPAPLPLAGEGGRRRSEGPPTQGVRVCVKTPPACHSEEPKATRNLALP